MVTKQQTDRTRYGVRLYSLRSRIDEMGLKQIPSKLHNGGYWESQSKIRNTQYFTGTLMDEGYLKALEHFVKDKENEKR